MGFLSVIRRCALRDKMPIREIARRTGLSRNTIKKYLREDAVEPKFKTLSRPSKLDPYADRLSAWLLAQTRKSRKERRNVKLMYEIKRILRDSEVHHRSYGTDDTTDTGPSHAFSNQIVPILQGISPAVVCQVLCPTSLN